MKHKTKIFALASLIALATFAGIVHADEVPISITWNLHTQGNGQNIIAPSSPISFGMRMPQTYANAIATTTAGSLATSTIKTYNFSNVAAGTLATSSVPLIYYFEVSGVDIYGGQTLPSPEVSTGITTGSSTNEVTVNWAALPGAKYYDLYVGTSTGAEGIYASTTALTFTLATTTVSSTISGSPTAVGVPNSVDTAYIDNFNSNGAVYLGGNVDAPSFSVNGATIANSSGITGFINQTNPAGSNVFVAPLIVGDIIMGGTGVPTFYYGTSTTLSANGFCGVYQLAVVNNTSTATSTLNFPTLAAVQSSTFATGGCGPLVAGADETQYVYNSSTAASIVNASSGITFYLPATTTTPIAIATSTSVTLPSRAVAEFVGQDINTTTFFAYVTIY